VFFLKNQIFHEKIEILKNGQKYPWGLVYLKLYKKFHQAATFSLATNSNKKLSYGGGGDGEEEPKMAIFDKS